MNASIPCNDLVVNDLGSFSSPARFEHKAISMKTGNYSSDSLRRTNDK